MGVGRSNNSGQPSIRTLRSGFVQTYSANPRFLLNLYISSYFHPECGNHSLCCITAFQNVSTHMTSFYCDKSWLGLAGPFFQVKDLSFRQADSCKAVQKTGDLEATLPPTDFGVFIFLCKSWAPLGWPAGT